MPKVFFVLNQDLSDGSAHALYLQRHLVSLAQGAPAGWRVEVLLPVAAELPNLPGLSWRRLPSIRRRISSGGQRRGWQVNAIFHFFVRRAIREMATAEDWVGSASFPRLFGDLTKPGRRQNSGPRYFYEIHQVEELSRPPGHPKCQEERKALAGADLFYVTTEPLARWAQEQFPQKPVTSVGLAVSYARQPQPESEATGPLKLGYFGSVSAEQGIPWLVENWSGWRAGLMSDAPLPELHIYGRARAGESLPESNPAEGIFCFPPEPSKRLPEIADSLHGLVIPALDQAHRASIAFTKAYDFIGLGLPLITSDLPTIREVLPLDSQAWFFAPGDTSGLHRCLSEWSSHPALRAEKARLGFARSLELTWSKRAEVWWNSLLAPTGSQRI
jgi:glycosyltransferase involved in cell wall biosynthesis